MKKPLAHSLCIDFSWCCISSRCSVRAGRLKLKMFNAMKKGMAKAGEAASQGAAAVQQKMDEREAALQAGWRAEFMEVGCDGLTCAGVLVSML